MSCEFEHEWTYGTKWVHPPHGRPIYEVIDPDRRSCVKCGQAQAAERVWADRTNRRPEL